ncbi:ion transporter [Nocardia sp. NEAU-G5]|uniref:Ion transporter n=1 Tax=Nocardia albiluteola TaxID=2842303 RepID=A0ABS6AS55_9NOCA|nr:ion transporter [Nocardia albiluteola]MBU3060420.1 ion transporter [Nocardia albiluteola]
MAQYRTAAGQQEYPRKPPILWTDYFMLAVALVSAALIGWVDLLPVPGGPWLGAIVIADYVTCGIFALEFLWRWRREDWSWNFPFVYWYEVLCLIPATAPYFHDSHTVRIVVLLVRVLRLADRVFGDQVTVAIVNRSMGAIVEAIKRPVTMAVLEEITAVLRVGQYTRNIASALEENHAELDAMIMELIKNDPQLGRVRYMPFHDEIIRGIANTAFRVISQVLADPRIDELVGDVLRENVHQMRRAIHEGVRVAETVDNKPIPSQ